MTHTEPCGCKHNGSSWLLKCDLHRLQDSAIAARWAADHVRRSPQTEFTPEYLALARQHDPELRHLDPQKLSHFRNCPPAYGGKLVENLVQHAAPEARSPGLFDGLPEDLDWLDQ